MRSAIIIFPWLVVIIFAAVLNIEDTFRHAWWMLSENRPIEVLTFLAAFIAAGVGVINSWLTFKLKKSPWITTFYASFSFVMLFIAMEEIAWGQQYFRFETLELMKRYNAQGEFTFHNMNAVQQHNEWLRLAFGMSVAIGIFFNKIDYLRVIAVPTMLTGWVVLIVIHALIDIYNDQFPIQQQFDLVIRFLSEVCEFLISTLALIFITIKWHCLGQLQKH